MKSVQAVSFLLLAVKGASWEKKIEAYEYPGVATQTDFYNILSIDGGGMKSMIPAIIIEKMEAYAHTYAASKWTGIPSTDDKIHMSDLFQLVAGTSSGSIVAAGVSYGKAGVPTMWGSDIVDFFTKNGKDLFEPHSLPLGLHITFWVLFALIFAFVGYVFGQRRYDSPGQVNAFENLRMLIANAKCQAKGRPPKFRYDQLHQVGGKVYGEKKGIRVALLNAESQVGIVNYYSWLLPSEKRNLGRRLQKQGCDLRADFLEIYASTIPQDQLETIRNMKLARSNAYRRYKENRPGKWWVVIEFFLMGIIAGYYIPLWFGMAVNPHQRTRIDTLMKTTFPGGLDDFVTDETLLVSYDYQQQMPYFYSKYYAHKYRDSGEKIDDDKATAAEMTVGESVAASAASPSVFKPYSRKSVDGQQMELVDGGVACANPTLYAFNMARNLYGYENVRILSLGSFHLPFKMYEPQGFSTDSKYKNHGEMTSNMMAYTTDYFISYNDYSSIDSTQKVVESDDFIRVDGEGTDLDVNEASTTDITALQGIAKKIWDANQTNIETMLQKIIDEKAKNDAKWVAITPPAKKPADQK